MLRCISATAAVSRETAPPVATSLSNGSLQIASMGNALSPPPLGVPEVGVVVDLPPRTWFGGPQTGISLFCLQLPFLPCNTAHHLDTSLIIVA